MAWLIKRALKFVVVEMLSKPKVIYFFSYGCYMQRDEGKGAGRWGHGPSTLIL